MHKVKQCTKCRTVKKLDAFAINKRNKKTGRQPKCKECNREYYLANQERVQKRVMTHYNSNHEEILERRGELRKRPEAKAKKAQQDKAYYINNKEQISERYKAWAKVNRENLRRYWKEWYHNDLEKNRMYGRWSTQARRNKVRKNGNNTLTLRQVEELFEKHPYCEYCKKYKVKLVIEHVIPISRGGQNYIDNVTIACEACNLSKSNKLLSEWKPDLYK